MVASRTALRAWALVAGALLVIAACLSWVSTADAALPDARAYELVSPPDKSGADVIAQSYKTFAATDGNGVAWPATGAFAGALGTSVDVQYLSRRDGRAGTSGWRTHSINPAGGSQTLQALVFSQIPSFEAAFTDDLTAGVYRSWRPLTDAPNVERAPNLYRVDLEDLDESEPELLTGAASPLDVPGGLGVLFRNALDGASRDLRHIFYQSPWNLTGDGAFSFAGDLYEFADGVGVRRVGRIPVAPATSCDDVASGDCVDASAQAGITATLTFGNSMHSAEVISDDGSRIVFTVTAGDMAGALFLREDGARTFHVNASEKTTPEAAQSAVAWGISRDGSRVFFTTSEGLVDGDDSGGQDVYMYDRNAPDGERLTRLSVNARGDSCDAEGVVGASIAGDVVYFLCNGKLVEGEPFSQSGLFRWQEGGTFAYLGRFGTSPAQLNTPRTPWQFVALSRASRMSLDGRSVLFMAFGDDGFVGVGGFSGYEHEGLRQLYLYSAERRRLVCVSCNPRASAATGDALTDFKAPVSATAHTQHLSHALSDDGRRVFFSSPEALVVGDSNGRWDAYEYDAPSGTLHLISSGKDPADSYFIEATASGDDVFFATRERLVGWDVDLSYDLYDARVGGGFPEPVPAAQACAGEACRASASVPPAAVVGASRQSRGAGDARPRLRRHRRSLRCRRGKVLKRVRGRRRCVKRRSRRARTGAVLMPAPQQEGLSPIVIGIVLMLAIYWFAHRSLERELAKAREEGVAHLIDLSRFRREVRLVSIGIGVLFLMVVGWTSSAFGAVRWDASSVANSSVAPGGSVEFVVLVTNLGDVATDGSDVTFTASFPAGLVPVSSESFSMPPCGIVGQVLTCTGPANVAVNGDLDLRIVADAAVGGSGVQTVLFDVSGGGAVSATQSADPIQISPLEPPFGIDAFDAMALDETGVEVTQAGGHPEVLLTSIDFNTHTDPLAGPRYPVEDVKDVTVDLPPGFVGSVAGLGECTIPELGNGTGVGNTMPLCAPTSQVGIMTYRVDATTGDFVAVYNMVPPPGVPARFGVNIAGTIVVLDAEVVRSGGYHLRVRASDIPQGLAVDGNSFVFWGVPAQESHRPQRSCAGGTLPSVGGPACESGADLKAFFRNPTSCTNEQGLAVTVAADSWQNPGAFVQRTILTHDLPGYPFAPVDWGLEQGTTGCETVPFDPEIVAQPLEGAKAASPAAFSFDLTIPQDDEPGSTAQSDLRKAVVTLPAGVRVNPSSADGLAACSPGQIALQTTDPPACPDASKLGTVTIDTPLIDDKVTGHVYLATPFANPFNSLVAVYIVASARGVVIKLPGAVSLDPSTGQIRATFDDNPQLPFDRLHVEFFGGGRAALTIPNRCGTYVTHAEFTGWNGRSVSTDSSFTVAENARGRPCPPKFSPSFSAGTESNSAGSSSSFLLRFTREDDDQAFSGLTVNLPRGLTGRIASADQCSDLQASSDTCPANAKIGDVTVGAGAGSNPFFIQTGRAYLTGPYRGAPFGVAIVVPAVAGPFDLGKVTVRSALFVDPYDATVRIVSDPFPTILQGIPLDVRDVRVTVNKPGFFLNPTSCAEKRITGTLTSTEGTRANVSDRFQAVECASLAFKPRMVMRVGGRGHTRRNQTSPFTTRLTMPQRNQTNIRFVRVTLPTTVNGRLNTINDACTRAEFESDLSRCAHAKAGTATADTPLLRDPLRGTVYFVRNGHPIPDLFIALRGEVDFNLVGQITIPDGKRLRTTFATAPDVPIRSFTLRLLGGRNTASIGAVRNLCSRASRRQKAEVDYIGHNGKIRQVDQALKVAGCGRSHRRHRRR